MTKLKISNTIKTALDIYRDRFREYYHLALINSFWIFVPIYGWAKYAAMMGLLARLAYGDATGNPETITEAKRYIKPKTWFFFGAGLIGSLIFYLKLLRVLITLYVVIYIAVRKHPYLLFNIPFWLVISGVSFSYFYYLMSRLFLYELPLAVGENVNATASRDIGWELATNSIFQLQVIIFSFSAIFIFPYFIHNLISGDLTFVSNINLFPLNFLNVMSENLFFCGVIFIPALSSIIGILLIVIGKSYLYTLFYTFLGTETNIVFLLFSSVTITIVNIIFGALFLPFWQSLKAVAYDNLNQF